MNTDRKLLYGSTPEQYAHALLSEGEHGESYLKRLLAANDQLEPDDPQSPIQRNNQPMASNLTDENGNTSWKKDNGNYMPAVSFSKALLDDKTGGSYKNYLNNLNPKEQQEWLNNHYGGRGLGYMGQNKFHRQPSRYGPGTTYDMDERRANVTANARRIRARRLRGMS